MRSLVSSDSSSRMGALQHLGEPASINLSVDFRCAYVDVPQYLLDVAQGASCTQEMIAKGVAKIVGAKMRIIFFPPFSCPR